MRFHADLHIHSKYSRATSRDLDLEHLAAWAGRKGIAVVATGDFTHPAWRAELKEKLVPAAPGLFRLRPEIEREVVRELPAACQTLPQFMLAVEISTIYKKGDRTRKVHHLIYAPDFETADRCSAALARIGNITSDGRPILGLDSRDLLEIALASGPDAYLVPAHIWTPWFAALGSMSGFDSIAECYGDLAHRIFAVETGLSSDPAMNWRLSQLDRYRLVSNSDAHSPGKLGREATTFACEVDYYAIRAALETGEGYVGTVEFFPEEGKYHLDGHRKCGVRQTPRETLAQDGRCRVCGQPTTVGVLHRVEALADRREEDVRPPATAGEVSNFVPLPELIGEIAASGPGSKTVARHYDRLLSALGAELPILGAVPLEDIARATSSLFAEAIARLRAGQVIRESGYDGEYGIIRLFEETELRRFTAGGLLFEKEGNRDRSPVSTPAPPPPAPAAAPPSAPPAAGASMSWTRGPEASEVDAGRTLFDADAEDVSRSSDAVDVQPRAGVVIPRAPRDLLASLDPDQRAAAETVDGPVVIVAGPGSGKTRTLTHRIAHLIAARGVPASSCLAITFTRRAAAEMRERLAALLPAPPPETPLRVAARSSFAVEALGLADDVAIHTFHSLGLSILREHHAAAGLPPAFRIADDKEQVALLSGALGIGESRARTLLRAISKAKRTHCAEEEASEQMTELSEAMSAYGEALAMRGCIDFDDLVGLALQLLCTDPSIAASYRARYRWISVDEFQDVDEQQYRLIGILAPPSSAEASDVVAAADEGPGHGPANLCVIGDPNQAIYAFRGADASCFDRFAQDYPEAARVALTRNYRSTGTIVTASSQMLSSGAPPGADANRPLAEIVRDMHERITIQVAPTDRAEAELIVQTIESLIGGLSLDPGRPLRALPGLSSGAMGFGDVAVLYRTSAQAAVLCEAFARSGIPFATHGHDLLIEDPAVRALLDTFGGLGSANRASDAPHPVSDAGASHSGASHSASQSQSQASRSLASRLRAADDRLATQESAPDVAARDRALHRLLSIAEACEDDDDRFADAVPLATEADFWDPRADRVSLLTLHAAKGLEFPVVFIAGLEDGILPLHWQELDEKAAAEERRLFYVGMTRAKDRLILTRAIERPWRGRLRTLQPSPFLDAIEQELVKHQQAPPVRARVEDRQLRLL